MRLLINLLNECFSENPCWKFHVIQESSWEWVDLQICYDRTRKEIRSSYNWNKNDLAHLYWEADLISSESENELEEWVRKETFPHRVKGIAPDTNLIIPGFLTKFLKKLTISPHDIVPVLVLFARSIQYEIHNMRPFTYSSRLPSDAENFFEQAVQTWPLLTELWNFKLGKYSPAHITRLSNERGRLGLKGTYEVDALHKWAPVIIVKPSHILHSPKVLEQNPFLNAVHDSLIRYEVDFIRQNTSLPILFITNDKDQCKSAIQEGVKALHIRKPGYEGSIEKIARNNLDLERIRTLLLSLLAYSPAVRLTSQTGKYYLSWTWCGRNMDDVHEHRIRMVDSTGMTQILNP
ncbi:MAG: hypothetical protein ACFFAE_18170 [Candidatus Hodarchaeota archaeon]